MGSLRSLRRKERPEPVAPPVPSDADFIETIYHGTFKDVKALLKQGANSCALSPRGTTALGVAAYSGKLRVVQVLLKHGADVHQRNGDGSTALHLAIITILGMVLKIGLFLLDHGADVNAADSFGQTPLMAAVRCREFDFAKLLLERGANPKLRNQDWKRAVDMIGQGRGSKTLRKLLKKVS